MFTHNNNLVEDSQDGTVLEDNTENSTTNTTQVSTSSESNNNKMLEIATSFWKLICSKTSHEVSEDSAHDSIKELTPGTVVFCNLSLVVQHSGICIGDKIVHLDGKGIVVKTSPLVFLKRLGGRNPASTIYYCAKAPDEPLAMHEIADRALARVGEKMDYNLFKRNCHRFTLECVTGNSFADYYYNKDSIRKIIETFKQKNKITDEDILNCLPYALHLRQIEEVISETFKTDDWKWRCWDDWPNPLDTLY